MGWIDAALPRPIERNECMSPHSDAIGGARWTACRRAMVTAVAAWLGFGGVSSADDDARSAGPATSSRVQPNIIVIMSDDQRWDTLAGIAPDYMPQDVMPALKQRLMDRGAVFTQAFTSVPLCCPARASFLAGGVEPHNTGVLNNQWPNGGATLFNDQQSLATWLGARGYRTALIGKYLNEYEQMAGTDPDGRPIAAGRYVPPAWDVFLGHENVKYFGKYPFTLGMAGPDGPRAGLRLAADRRQLPPFLAQLRAAGFPPTLADFVEDFDYDEPPYVTEFHKGAALSYLADAATFEAPFFLFISTTAAHRPAYPDPQDAHLFPGFEYRARGWGEPDLKDKPAGINREAEPFDGYYDGSVEFSSDGRLPDEVFADQLRSLRAVDRLVDEVLAAVDADPELRDNTVIVYTSDHGFQWGEHRVFDKAKPYEEVIRVPLVVRVPGLDARVIDEAVTCNLDVAATLLELAGYSANEIKRTIRSDGKSLMDLLEGQGGRIRRDVMVQDFSIFNPAFALLRNDKWKYTRWDTGEEELYKLSKDPFELSSRHDSGKRSDERAKRKLAGRLEKRRGLALLAEGLEREIGLPTARVGVSYDFQLPAAGGKAPRVFRIFDEPGLPEPPEGCDGVLPEGITLTTDGKITGTPRAEGCGVFWVAVEDQSRSRQHGGPQRMVRKFKLVVDP